MTAHVALQLWQNCGVTSGGGTILRSPSIVDRAHVITHGMSYLLVVIHVNPAHESIARRQQARVKPAGVAQHDGLAEGPVVNWSGRRQALSQGATARATARNRAAAS